MTTKELKVSKICRTIANIIRGVLISIIVLVVTAGLFILLSGGGEWIVVTTGEKSLSMAQYVTVGVFYSLIFACALVGAYLQYKIFNDIAKDARPFKMLHAKRINKIVYLMIVMLILQILADLVITWPTISLSLDLGFMMSILVIKGVAVILESGCDLQEQVDTTL